MICHLLLPSLQILCLSASAPVSSFQFHFFPTSRWAMGSTSSVTKGSRKLWFMPDTRVFLQQIQESMGCRLLVILCSVITYLKITQHSTKNEQMSSQHSVRTRLGWILVSGHAGCHAWGDYGVGRQICNAYQCTQCWLHHQQWTSWKNKRSFCGKTQLRTFFK